MHALIGSTRYSSRDACELLARPAIDLGVSHFDGSYMEAPGFTYPAGFFNFTSLGLSLRLHPRLVTLAQDTVLLLDEARIEGPDGDADTAADTRLQTRCCILQIRLMSFLEAEPRLTERSLGLSLLCVLMTLGMPSDPRLERMQQHAVAQLRDVLLQTTGDQWSAFPLALLWIVTIAATCCEGSEHQGWFMDETGAGCQKLAVHDLGALLEGMKSLAWLDARLQSPARELWSRIQGGGGGHPERLFAQVPASSVASSRPAYEPLRLAPGLVHAATAAGT